VPETHNAESSRGKPTAFRPPLKKAVRDGETLYFFLFLLNTPYGYQFTFIGNEVDNDGGGAITTNSQWGIGLNNSHWGLVQNNDVWNIAGAGIGVEDYASSYNLFDANMVGDLSGTCGRLDSFLQGDGFWFGNPNNRVTNNIVTVDNPYNGGTYCYGYDFGGNNDNMDACDANTAGCTPSIFIPAYQGADPAVSGQSQPIFMSQIPILQFANNTVYGASAMGLTYWFIGTYDDNFNPNQALTVIKNMTAWNLSLWGVFAYSSANLTIDGLTVLGDPNQIDNQFSAVVGITYADYMTRGGVVTNANIQNALYGIEVPGNVGRKGAQSGSQNCSTTLTTDIGLFTVENSYLNNPTNIDVGLINNSNFGTGLSGRKVVIQNVQFAHPANGPWEQDVFPDNSAQTAPGFFADYSVNSQPSDQTFVYDYNGNASDNYQLFYPTSGWLSGFTHCNAAPSGTSSNALLGSFLSVPAP
jgi:hypothetical protein